LVKLPENIEIKKQQKERQMSKCNICVDKDTKSCISCSEKTKDHMIYLEERIKLLKIERKKYKNEIDELINLPEVKRYRYLVDIISRINSNIFDCRDRMGWF
jgi:hypothetical protein